MGVRVAYGPRAKITSAIASDIIPKDSLIITDDSAQAELFFYDADGVMKPISERTRFAAISEAQAWIETYDCAGHIIAVQNGADWTPYVVTADRKLSPVASGSSVTVDDVKYIDGGTAEGAQ